MSGQNLSILIGLTLGLLCFGEEAQRPVHLSTTWDGRIEQRGSTFYESPSVDRIAEGMKFTRGTQPVRFAAPPGQVFDGKYPTNHGITTWIGDRAGEAWRGAGRHDSHLPPEYERNLRASEITLAEAMKADGYKTFFAGKWHLGSKGSWPTDHGFEINKGGWDVGSPRGGFFSPWQNPNLESGPKGESLTLRLGRETADFIEDHKDQPFLAYLSFYTVHGPIQTTPELWKKYRDKAEKTGLAKERFLFDRRLNVRQVQDCPIYAGMIELMDKAIGTVLAKLDEHGLDKHDHLFTSDNGGVSPGTPLPPQTFPCAVGRAPMGRRNWRPFYLKPREQPNPDAPAASVSGIDWYPTT